MTTPPPLPDAVFAALPPAVQAYIRSLEAVAAQVAALQARVAELEARLGQDSSNSSRPPSSDGPQVNPAPPRTPSGKTRGGQPGHTKHERAILPPDEVIDHKPTHCRRCATPVAGEDPAAVVDQVLDLPVRLRHVVHHRRHTLACPNCHAPTTAAPVPQASTGFGPRLTATVAYLSGVGRLSKRAVRTLLADVCDLPVSLGAVSKLEQTVSRALAPVHVAAHTAAKGADANVDETGWKQGAAKAWLWVAVTATLTIVLIRPNRNRAAFDALAGPTPGVLTTDRYGVYTHLIGTRRQVCWAHLRRDFQAMIDRRNAGAEVGQALLDLADILFDHWQNVRDGTRTREWFRRTHRGWLRAEVLALLTRVLPVRVPRRPGSAGRLWAWRSHCGRSPGGRGSSRRTTRPSGRCVTPCAGGRRVSGRTASGAAGSSSGC